MSATHLYHGFIMILSLGCVCYLLWDLTHPEPRDPRDRDDYLEDRDDR